LINSIYSILQSFIYFSGAIFEQGTTQTQTAFKYALMLQNQRAEERRFEFQAFVDVINTADAFKLSRISEFLVFRFSFPYFMLAQVDLKDKLSLSRYPTICMITVVLRY